MYEIGKKYKFHFEDFYRANDGKNYLHLKDPRIPDSFISVKPYSFQTDWYDTTEWLECYCKRQDDRGRFRFELSRDALLNYWYRPKLGQIQCFTIDKRVRDNNNIECFSILDPYGINQLFFPDPKRINDYKIGDELNLKVIDIKGSSEGKNNAYLILDRDNGEQVENDEIVIRDNTFFSLGDEGEQQEFKASIAYAAGETNKNMERQLSILMRSIAGFMNKDGGTLYIGVNDSGEPYKDISEEFQYLNDDSTDGYEYRPNADHYRLKLINKIGKDLGGYAATLANVELRQANGVTYAAIIIQQAASVVWYQQEELYVRCGNCTRRLRGNNITSFILGRVRKDVFMNIANEHYEADALENGFDNAPVAENKADQSQIKKEHVWRYLYLFNNGEWMCSKKSSIPQDDVLRIIPIPKNPKTKRQVMMIAYASGKVCGVNLKELLFTAKGKEISPDVRKKHTASVNDRIVGAFCMEKDGLILMQSEFEGKVKIKAHKMEAVSLTKSITAGYIMIPEGTLTHIAPIDSAEKSSIEAMGIVVKDYERYNKNGVDKEKLQGKYQELIDKILTIHPQNG